MAGLHSSTPVLLTPHYAMLATTVRSHHGPTAHRGLQSFDLKKFDGNDLIFIWEDLNKDTSDILDTPIQQIWQIYFRVLVYCLGPINVKCSYLVSKTRLPVAPLY